MQNTEASVNILKFDLRHLDEVAKLELESFTMPWTKNMLREEMLSENGFYIVAESETAIVGYAGIKIIFDAAHITTIAVAPSLRGCGIGRTLIRELLAEASKRRLAEATLEVRVSNAPAIQMYQSFGFETLGLRRNYYSSPVEDAIIMTLRLENT